MTSASDDRVSSQDVNELVEHIKLNIIKLPELAKKYKLNEESVDFLRRHLQDEIDYLNNNVGAINQETMMDNHFSRSTEFGKIMTEITKK